MRVGTPNLCKNLSLKHLLISIKTTALAQAVQNKGFLEGPFGKAPKWWYPKLCRNFCLVNISCCKKNKKQKNWGISLFQQIDFCGVHVRIFGCVVPPNYVRVFVCKMFMISNKQ